MLTLDLPRSYRLPATLRLFCVTYTRSDHQPGGVGIVLLRIRIRSPSVRVHLDSARLPPAPGPARIPVLHDTVLETFSKR